MTLARIATFGARVAYATALGLVTTLAATTTYAQADAEAKADADAARQRQFKCQGAQSGEDKNWSRYGHDLKNNRCSETKIKPDKLALDWQIDGLTAVTSLPVSDSNKIYFGDWDGNLHKVNGKTGEAIWEVDLGNAIRSTPLVQGSRVYAATNNTLFAVDVEDGETLWSTVLDTHPNALIESSPVFVDGMVIVGVAGFELIFDQPEYTFRGGIVALDASSGAEVWRVYTTNNDGETGAGVSVWSSPAIDKQRHLLYIGTGQAYSAPASPLSDAVLAIDYQNGTVAWVNQFTSGDVYTVPDGGPGVDADIGATPNLIKVGNRDLVTVGSKAGLFKAIDRDTGATVWERQLTPGSTLGGIMSSAATDGKVIYTNSNSWTAFGWITQNTHNPADTSTTFALDAATGNTLWSVPMQAPMFGAMALADGTLYHGLIDGSIVGLDATTGELVFETQAPGTIGSGFSIADKRIYVSYGFNFFSGVTPDAGVLSFK